jgi:hypothetical protein
MRFCSSEAAHINLILSSQALASAAGPAISSSAAMGAPTYEPVTHESVS